MATTMATGKMSARHLFIDVLAKVGYVEDATAIVEMRIH